MGDPAHGRATYLETLMTRTEMVENLKLAGRILDLASLAHETSFATMCVGLPVTLLAFAGYSIWPGIILWSVSWLSYALAKRWMAQADAIHKMVERAREAQTRTPE